jgi:enoyl-CoA hydratase
MRSDRWSAYQVFGMAPSDALRREAEIGMEVIASGETLAGAERFAGGAGRGGDFSS